MLSCEQVREQFHNAENKDGIALHLQTCEPCKIYMEQYEQMRQVLPMHQGVPPALTASIQKHVQHRSKRILLMKCSSGLAAAALLMAGLYYAMSSTTPTAPQETPAVHMQATQFSWSDLEAIQARVDLIEQRVYQPQHLLSKYQRERDRRLVFKKYKSKIKPFKL